MSQAPYILLCDDEAHILHVLGLKLQEAGYRVLMARDGVEGLALAREHQPLLVITDYLMPKMDGLALCQNLRTESAAHLIDFVLLTARGATLDDNLLDELEFSAMFSKPFSPREVVHHVQKQVPLDVSISKGPSE
ncbi:MAG: response regulator [Planctomycetota bacterium]